MRRKSRGPAALAAVALLMAMTAPTARAAGLDESMVDGTGGWQAEPVFTVGESIGDYTPPGVLDGIGAYRLNRNTVRVLANHELGFDRGYPYEVSDGSGGAFTLTGARVSYFDVDRATREIVAAGPAYNAIYDANGDRASDASFLANEFPGFSRFCSASLFEAGQFGGGRGLADRVFLTGEEDGGSFNPVGGAEWALDPATGSMWHLPDLGRGAWENVTLLDTGSRNTVAIMLSDDTAPFDIDPVSSNGAEAAPLYLYVGQKDPKGDFPARNGLRGGKLYVFVAGNGATTPSEFNGSGDLPGRWVEIDNSPNLAMADEFGASGYDEFGYPTQRNLWEQARDAGAFGFSRPEDLATNPAKGDEVVLASTGVDTYENGVDTFGTIYTIKTNFNDMSVTARIIYDGDDDPARTLRSPDNLDWADDGWIYVQEDKAEEDTLDGEPLFGPGAANPHEAGIVRMTRSGSNLQRIATIDRTVVLDASIADPTDAVDVDAGTVGEWETSGIVDVSRLFGHAAGTLFLFDVQAHGIEDQAGFNPTSRITDYDLVEGGQLSFLTRG